MLASIQFEAALGSFVHLPSCDWLAVISLLSPPITAGVEIGNCKFGVEGVAERPCH